MDYKHIVTGERISRWVYQKLSHSDQQNYYSYNDSGFSGTPDYNPVQSVIADTDTTATETNPGGSGSEGEY